MPNNDKSGGLFFLALQWRISCQFCILNFLPKKKRDTVHHSAGSFSAALLRPELSFRYNKLNDWIGLEKFPEREQLFKTDK